MRLIQKTSKQKPNMEKREIIWEDSKQKPGFIIHFFLFIVPIIFLVISIVSFMISSYLASAAFLVLSILSLLHFILGIRMKYIVIERGGLWSGNNISGQLLNKLFRLKQKNIFIFWNDIRKIEIYDKIIAVSYAGGMVPFVAIKTKYGKEYECLIVNIEGFKKALKKLNKYHLLSKNSKYK